MHLSIIVVLTLLAAGSHAETFTRPSQIANPQRLSVLLDAHGLAAVHAKHPGDPSLSPVAPGEQLGQIDLNTLFNRSLALMDLELGAKTWLIGAALERATNELNITFIDKASGRIVAQAIDPQELKGNGKVIVLDDRTTYRMRLGINIV
ncbi:MAG: hypothetical protein AABZ44_05610, partial [Elusimicrobiota bacterium]